MKKEELKKRIAKYINKTVSYGFGDGFVQIDYTSPDGVEHIYIEEDIDDFTFIDFLEDYTLDILEIRKDVELGLSDSEIGKKFRVTASNIYRIRKDQTWRCVVL